MSYSLKQVRNTQNANGNFSFTNSVDFDYLQNRNVASNEDKSKKNLVYGLFVSSQCDIAEYNSRHQNIFDESRDNVKNKYCTDYVELNKSLNITNTGVNSVTVIDENIIKKDTAKGLNPTINAEINNTLNPDAGDANFTPYFEFLFPLRLTPVNCDAYDNGDEVYSACVEYPILHFRIWKLHDIKITSQIKNVVNVGSNQGSYAFNSLGAARDYNLNNADDSVRITDQNGEFDINFMTDSANSINFYGYGGDHFDCRIIFPKKQGSDSVHKTLIFNSQIISACMGIKNVTNTIKTTLDDQEIYITGLKDEDIHNINVLDSAVSLDDEATFKEASDATILNFKNFKYLFQIIKSNSENSFVLNIKIEDKQVSTPKIPLHAGRNNTPYFKVNNNNDYLLDQITRIVTKLSIKDSDFCKKIMVSSDFLSENFLKGKKYDENLGLKYYPDTCGLKVGLSIPSLDKKYVLDAIENAKTLEDLARVYNSNQSDIRWDLIRWEYVSFRGRNKENVKNAYPNIEDFKKKNVLHANYFEQTNFSYTLQTVCFSKNMLGYYAIKLPESISNLLYKDAVKDVYQVNLRTLYKLILKDIIGVSVSSAD